MSNLVLSRPISKINSISAADGNDAELFLESGPDQWAIVHDGDDNEFDISYNDEIKFSVKTDGGIYNSLREVKKLLSGDPEVSGNFGFDVAVSGDAKTVLVGARAEDSSGADAGAVYVFIRSGGTWELQQKLTASDASAGDLFGTSVSISGDGNIAIVGADTADVSGSPFIGNSGAAYIFYRSSGIWIEQQKIFPSNIEANAIFGAGVIMSGDGETMVISADGEDSVATDAGAVYVFTRLGNTWNEQQRLIGSDTSEGHRFGEDVAISNDGNTILVGSTFAGGTLGSPSPPGQAYIFRRLNGSPTWTEEQILRASDAQNRDFFGFGLTLSNDGNTAAVGARFEDEAGLTSGSVYVFVKTDGSPIWTEQQKLTASDAIAGEQFGVSAVLSSNGNKLAVGAHLTDSSGSPILSNIGAIYIFTRSDGTWTQQQKLTASDAQSADLLGQTVSMSADGNTLVAGARFEDEGGTSAGAAYIFTNDLAEQQTGFFPKENYQSFVVGDDRWDLTHENNNELSFLYNGNFRFTFTAGGSFAHHADTGESTSLTLEGGEKQWTIAHDGFSNYLEIAYNNDRHAIFTKDGIFVTRYLEQIRVSGLNDVDTPNATNLLLGESVALSADGNTLLVGAQSGLFPGNDGGHAYVFVRYGDTWLLQAEIVPDDIAFRDQFGTSVNLSADGNTAVITSIQNGAQQAGSPKLGLNGKAYIFTRSIGGLWREQAILEPDDITENVFASFGENSAISADGNICVIGAPEAPLGSPANDNGAVYIFRRNGGIWSLEAKLQPEIDDTSPEFGRDVTISDDGETIAVGAPLEDRPGSPRPDTDDGAAYVFVRNSTGSPITWSQQAKLRASEPFGFTTLNSFFGNDVILSNDGNFLYVSAPNRNPALGSPIIRDIGGVYVFDRIAGSPVTWEIRQVLTPVDDDADRDTLALFGDASFGSAMDVSFDGNILAVGARNENTLGLDVRHGAVYLYHRNEGSPQILNLTQKFLPPQIGIDSAAPGGPQFGWEVSLSSSGHTLVVSSRNEERVGSADLRGAFYVYSDGQGTNTSLPLKTGGGGPINAVYVEQGGSDETGDGTLLGPFRTIEHAYDYITDASEILQYAIVVGPGRYTENPLVAKDNVILVGHTDSFSTVIVANDPTSSIWTHSTSGFAVVQDITFSGTNTGVSAVAISNGGVTRLKNTFYEDNGICIDIAGGTVDISTSTPRSDSNIDTFVRATGGDVSITATVVGEVTATTLYDFSGSDTTVVFGGNNVITSPNIDRIMSVDDGATVEISLMNISEAKNGFVIDNGSVVNALSLNIQVQNISVEVIDLDSTLAVHAGELTLANMKIPDGYKNDFLAVLDYAGSVSSQYSVTTGIDVGRAEKGVHSSIGGGNPYARGMLVVSTDGTATPTTDGGNFINLATEAATKASSDVKFQGTTANHTILLGSMLNDGDDVIKHFGFYADQIVAATSPTQKPFVIEYWNGSSWEETSTMTNGRTFPHTVYGNSLFIRENSNESIRYNQQIDSTWAKKTINVPAYQVVDLGENASGSPIASPSSVLTGLANDSTVYTAIVEVDSVENTISITGSNAQTYPELLSEINADLTGATASLLEGNIRITHDTPGPGDIRIFDRDLFSSLTLFSSVKPPLVVTDTNLYWARIRIKNNLTVAPTFEQFRLHPNSFHVHGDGTVALFGNSRVRRSIILGGDVYSQTGGLANANVDIGNPTGSPETFWTHRMNSQQINAPNDTIYVQFPIPEGIDTSQPILLKIIYSVDNAGASTDATFLVGALPLEVAGNVVADPDGSKDPIFRTLANTKTLTNDNAQETIVSVPAVDTTRLQSFDSNPIDISDFYAGDILALRLVMVDDGSGNKNFNLWTMELSAAHWQLGGSTRVITGGSPV